MNKTTLFIIWLLFLFLAETTAKTFYIDAVEGNDLNSGLTESSPWKTISKLNDNISQLLPGDSVLFKRGGVWIGERIYIEEISGTSTSQIVFGAYGDGETPVITSVTDHHHVWINDFGNLWKAVDPPEENPGRLWQNGSEILRANKRDELGEIFRWFYNDANGEFFLYSINDPSNDVFQYSVDFPMIVTDAEYIKIENLDLQGGWTTVYILGSRNIVFENMEIGAFAQNGISTDADSFSEVENLRILNCRFDSFFTLDFSSAEYYRGTGDRGCSDGVQIHSFVDGEISGCYFKNWGHASINLDGTRALITRNKIFNNYLTSPDIAYGGRIGVDGESSENEIFNNQIFYTSVQSQLDGRDNHYHHNIFYGTTSPPFNPPDFIGVGLSVQAYDENEVSGNIYENNLMMNCEGPGIEISGNNEHDVHDNVFRNNIIYNCGAKQNNVALEIEADEYAETYANYFQNNLIFNSSIENVISFKGTVINVAEFNSLSGADEYVIENNIGENPLFINASELDFHLQSGSPCIDAGIETLAQFDFEGNPIPYGTAPDIGVYEYSKPNGVNDEIEQPFEFKLFQNYPNPFGEKTSGNSATVIKFSIPSLLETQNLASPQKFVSPTTVVSLKVYDILGKEVATLINEKLSPGEYEVKFYVSGLSSGVYYYRLQMGNFAEAKKMILTK